MSRFPGRVRLFNPVRKKQRNLLTIKKDRDTFTVTSTSLSKDDPLGNHISSHPDDLDTPDRLDSLQQRSDTASRSPSSHDTNDDSISGTGRFDSSARSHTSTSPCLVTSDVHDVKESPSPMQSAMSLALTLFSKGLAKEDSKNNNVAEIIDYNNPQPSTSKGTISCTSLKAWRQANPLDISSDDDDDTDKGLKVEVLDFEGFSQEDVRRQRAGILHDDKSPSLSSQEDKTRLQIAVKAPVKKSRRSQSANSITHLSTDVAASESKSSSKNPKQKRPPKKAPTSVSEVKLSVCKKKSRPSSKSLESPASCPPTLDKESRKEKRQELLVKALANIKRNWTERMKSTSKSSPVTVESPALTPVNGSGPLSSGSTGILRQARLCVDDLTLSKIRSSKPFKSSSLSPTRSNISSSSSSSCSSSSSESESDSDVMSDEDEDEDDDNEEEDDDEEESEDEEASLPPKKARESVRKVTAKSKSPGEIVCSICGVKKFYSHKQRRFGQFSCESCSKFFATYIKGPKAYFCGNSGDCDITSSQGSRRRCKACWLKVCLQTFNISTEVRAQLTANNHLPKLKAEPHVSLIAVDTTSNLIVSPSPTPARNGQRRATPAKKSDKKKSGKGGLLMVAPNGKSDHPVTSAKGPRVKSVCRTSLTGLPRATFSPKDLNGLDHDSDDDDDVFLADGQESVDTEDSDNLPVGEYIARAYHLDVNDNEDKSKINGTTKGKKRSKSKEEVVKVGKIKKTKSEESVKSDKKIIMRRCGSCAGCQAVDCGLCNFCLDKKKFGGPNRIKQACKNRKCLNMTPTTMETSLSPS